MAKQTINIGTTANDGTGDAIRAAFGKVNDNFTEIYTANTGVNTGDQNLSAYATTAAVAAGYQPLDSDLTAISALTTTAYGRALLSTADAATLRSAIGVGTTDAPTFLAQTLTGQSLTGTQATSLVDLAATWNTTGTPSAIKLNVTDTASNAASNLMDLQVGGASKFNLRKDGYLLFTAPEYAIGKQGTHITFGRTVSAIAALDSGYGPDSDGFKVSAIGFFGWASSGSAVINAGTKLYQDAAGILAQRNGVNAQAFRVYNTYTDATNNSRLSFQFQGGYATIVSDRAASGAVLPMQIGTAGAAQVDIITNNTGRWRIDSTGHLLAFADNTYDIGASGANRPRSLYTSSIIDSGGKIICRSGSGIEVIVNGSTSCRLLATGDGVGLIANAFSNTFDRLQLGNTTDAFPAIARDGAGIKFTGAAAGSTSWIKVPAVAVASLPSAATAGVGARAFVNNALNPIFGNAVAGSGLSVVPVYSDGTNWNVG